MGKSMGNVHRFAEFIVRLRFPRISPQDHGFVLAQQRRVYPTGGHGGQARDELLSMLEDLVRLLSPLSLKIDGIHRHLLNGFDSAPRYLKASSLDPSAELVAHVP